MNLSDSISIITSYRTSRLRLGVRLPKDFSYGNSFLFATTAKIYLNSAINKHIFKQMLLFIEKSGTQAAGALDRLLVFPLVDFSFVSRQEYIRHFPSFIFRRTRVDRGRKQIVLK